MKKAIARNGKRFMANALFWARRTFVEKNLDPRQNSTLISWATYSPWLLDREFQETHAVIFELPRTLTVLELRFSDFPFPVFAEKLSYMRNNDIMARLHFLHVVVVKGLMDRPTKGQVA